MFKTRQAGELQPSRLQQQMAAEKLSGLVKQFNSDRALMAALEFAQRYESMRSQLPTSALQALNEVEASFR